MRGRNSCSEVGKGKLLLKLELSVRKFFLFNKRHAKHFLVYEELSLTRNPDDTHLPDMRGKVFESSLGKTRQ